MTSNITEEHKRIFEETKKNLTTIGAKESSFIKIELLFYDAIHIARSYGENVEENELLAALKQLQNNAYSETKIRYKKSTQQERIIKRFINQLKMILTASCKNEYALLSSYSS